MCFEGVLRVLQGRFKGLSFKFHGRGSLKDVSRVFHDFQGSFKSVSRSFKKTFNAFQKSLMLHVIAASRAEGGLVSEMIEQANTRPS